MNGRVKQMCVEIFFLVSKVMWIEKDEKNVKISHAVFVEETYKIESSTVVDE